MVPVFKQDFGQGIAPTSTSKAPAGSTNYNFGNVGTDGNYIITPLVQNANKVDWAKGSDHTGNTNGNMFLVNAGGSNSIFFQQNVPGLCAGSNYNFTAWIANVNSSNTQGVCGSGLVYPKIKFNIKDTSNVLLATYTTILIPLSPVNGPLNWQKYGFQFAMPSYTGELKLEIIDAWGGGAACGNDVVIDDILFEACVPKITVALTSSNDNVCIGGLANLQSTLTNNPYTNPYYLWQKSIDGGTVWNNIGTPGVGLNSYNITNAVTTDGGLYRVQVAPTTLSIINATCSAVSNGVLFTVNPLPKLTPTSNAPICSGNDLLLKANATAGSGVYSSYQWKGPLSFKSFKADTSIIAVKTAASGLYTIQVTDSKGCSDSTGLMVNIDSTPVLSVQSITDTICSGGLGKLILKSSLPNNKFFWNNAFVSGSIAGNISVINPELTGNFSSIVNNNGTTIGKIKYSIYAQSIAKCKSNTIDTFVSLLPKPSLANAGTDIAICSGTSVALNANTPIVGLGTWKQISGPNNASFADSAKANTLVANLVPGTYLFSWSIANNCATNIDTVILNYTPKPIPTFSMIDTVVCGPASILFTNNTPNKNNYTYAWNFGNGQSSSLANPLAVNFLASSTGVDTVYTVVLKAMSNCDTVSFTISVRVKRKVASQLTITPKNTCSPLLVELKNSSTGNINSIKLLFGDGTDTLINNNSTIQHYYQSNIDKNFVPSLIVTIDCGIDTIKGIVFVKANSLIINNNLKDTAVCGLPFTLNINNITTGASQFSFNWGDGSAAFNSPSNGSLQHVYTQPGTFTLSHTINHICGDTTIIKQIIISPLPTLANAGTDIATCSGSSITLNANTPAVGFGTWKQISGPNNASFADSSKANTLVANLVPGTYLFSWSIANNCATNIDTLVLNYTPKPVPTFSIADTVVCGPASILFTNNTPNKSNYTYAWNFGNGLSSSLANPLAVNFLASSTGVDTTYTIVLKAFSNCDTIVYTRSIRVKRKAFAQFTVSPKNTCLPLITSIRNESSGFNTTYKILFGDGKDSVIQQKSEFNYTYFGNKTQLFQPILLATNSCGTDTAFATVQAIANQLKINTNIKDTAVCGTPFTYSVSDNSSGGSYYEWNWGDGNISITKTAINQQHTYLQAGIYTVSQQIKHFCGDTSISKQIQIYPSIKASMLSIPTNLCIGDSILFSGFGDSTANFQWKINDSIYSNQSSFKLPFAFAGNYQSQLSIIKVNPGKTCSDNVNANFSIVSTKIGKANINPLSGNCIPTNVQLINQSNQATTTTWDMGDGNSIKGDTANYIYLQPGIFHIKMSAKNAGGCTFIDSSTIQIKSPKGNINFKSGLYCNSNNMVLFNPSVINTDSIEFDFGDGTKIITTSRSIQHQYTKPGIFFPSFTLISNAGCRVPVPKKDSIIIENVKAGFSVKTIFNCGITSFDFQDSSSSLSGIDQYTWMLNKVRYANTKNTSIDFKQTGTQETNLYVTSKWGCTDSISGAYKVSIYSFPQVNINSINEACLNNLMELKSEISSIDSIIYRIWNLGNGSKASDSTVRILYFDEGKYTVKLTAATINKCYDSAFKQLTIHPVPIIKMASTNRVCNGDSLILKADGATNYVWKDQQDNIICNNCITVKVRPQRSTAYKVIGFNEFGCTQVAATNVEVIDKTPISVSPESIICEGSSIRIWASGGNSYQWLPANGLNNFNSASPIVNPQITTTYKVIAKDAYNCFADTGFVKVIVGKPTPIKIGKDSSFVAGSKIQLKASAQQNDIIKWRWSGGADLSCIACSDPIARIVNDETIICTATNRYGCISADTIRFKTFCPNTEVFLPNAFTPDGDGVNDLFFVQARGISSVKSMRIYSRWGELVFEKFNFLPNDKGSGWNGRVRGILANPDVYVYLCEVVCEKGAVQLLKGNVAILK